MSSYAKPQPNSLHLFENLLGYPCRLRYSCLHIVMLPLELCKPASRQPPHFTGHVVFFFGGQKLCLLHLFTYFKFFKVSSMPNLGLELMTPKARVMCSTN